MKYGKRGRCGWLAWILVMLVSGCQGLPVWLGGAQPTAIPVGSLLFSDDFSVAPNGWGISQSPNAAVAFERDGLRILIGEAGKDAWSVTGRKFGDVAIAAGAKRLSGPENNMLGVICRYLDRSNYYLAFISSDGYYGIAKIEQDSFQLISAEQLQYSSMLVEPAGDYRIEMGCKGELLWLSVNGTILAQAQDAAFTDGDVGVFAGAYEQPGVDILFDNFEVRQP